MPKGLKIGSAAVGIAFIVGLVAFLFNRVGNLKEATQVRDQEIYRLEWLLSAKEAENDTLKAIGQYSIPDSAWDSIPVPYAVYDTVTGDSVILYKKIPWLKLVGSIGIDTIAKLGSESNPLYIRVECRLYYPPEYGSQSWMLVYPDRGKPPYLPVTPRSPDKWGMGLVYIRSVSGANLGYAGDYLGASVAYKRVTFSAAYDPWRKAVIGGIGLKVWGF